MESIKCKRVKNFERSETYEAVRSLQTKRIFVRYYGDGQWFTYFNGEPELPVIRPIEIIN